MNGARIMQAVKDELPECVRGMVGIIPAGEGDSVEEYHEHLLEKYDSEE